MLHTIEGMSSLLAAAVATDAACLTASLTSVDFSTMSDICWVRICSSFSQVLETILLMCYWLLTEN